MAQTSLTSLGSRFCRFCEPFSTPVPDAQGLPFGMRVAQAGRYQPAYGGCRFIGIGNNGMPSISHCDLLFVCSLLASLPAMAQEPPRTGIPSFQGAVGRILRGVEDLPAGLQPGETPTEERPEVKDCKEAVSMISKGIMGKTNFDYDNKFVNKAPPTNVAPRKYVVRGEVTFVLRSKV